MIEKLKEKAAVCGRVAEKLLFPPICPFCGEVLGFLPACSQCSGTAEALKLPDGGLLNANHYQADYLKDVYAVYQYDSVIRSSIHRFKFQQQLYLAEYYAKEMAEQLDKSRYDCIVPVPASFREIQRHKGCHGAFLLAGQLHRILKIPFYKKVLLKRYDTEPQHDLNAIRRAGNLVGSMIIKDPDLIAGKDILLVDDLTTTGNTLDYCAKLCMAYGAASVTGICYAEALYQEKKKTCKAGEE